MNFFENVSTADELKKAYRKLAFKHHPDRGGDTETMKLINKAYQEKLKTLGNEKDFKVSEQYREIIDDLIKYDIDIEIIGTWIWITGETFSIKAELKKHGFKWAKKKKAWYWHEGDYKKFSKKKYSLDEIRTMHESQVIKQARQAEKKALNA